jgi:hypothetical protein
MPSSFCQDRLGTNIDGKSTQKRDDHILACKKRFWLVKNGFWLVKNGFWVAALPGRL